MAYVYPDRAAPEYALCHYGTSRMQFRGPRRDTSGAYIVMLGGTETFGKFTTNPFAVLVEQAIGLPVVNLGAVNTGNDLYLHDASLLEIIRHAKAVVVQVVGAQNASNQYYHVHRRRNDRFIGATDALRALYPETDFTDFNYTRHMLRTLHQTSSSRFLHVAAELRSTWLTGMVQLLRQTLAPSVLLWIADHEPSTERGVTLSRDPLLVDAAMLAQIRPFAQDLVRCIGGAGRTPAAHLAEQAGMHVSVSMGLAGPEIHQAVARGVITALRAVLPN